MTSPAQTQLDCVQLLNESDQYQVLQRLQARSQFNETRPETVHKVCIIDTETTGLDTQTCEIIELGYQIIEFDSDGHFYQVLDSGNYLQEPNGEISAEVTKVTGLTMDQVKGQHIPWPEVEHAMADVQLFVAHNAAFDRPVLERYSDVFVNKIWGCSVAQIDWFELANVSSRSQEFLGWKVGQFFYDAHRALDDVHALSELLTQPISEPARPAFYYLLQSVRVSKSLIKATGAPFDVKDALRTRGYRWNVSARVWQRVIDETHLQDEQAWLMEHHTPNPTIIKLKTTDSFSVRAN